MDKSNMESYEIEHYEAVRKMAPECMVLLKQDRSFPIPATSKIALLGAGARHTYRGGTGGGIVEVRGFTAIEQGLLNSGFQIVSSAWLDAYDKLIADAAVEHKKFVKNTLAVEGLTGLGALNLSVKIPDYDFDTDYDADAGVYILSRVSGEGADRSDVPGDLRLSDVEIRDIKRCCEHYGKFMLVLNVSGVVDLSPIVDIVPNILLLSQTGVAIGDSFADVLCGKAYPSGKLATTWAKTEDYQHIGDWVERDDTRYKEGIYVGYRYFDAADVKPLFEFGYGLSYSDFEITCGKASMNGTRVSVRATVKNVGKHVGKEVVQVYVSMPNDYIDCPPNALVAFSKTRELQPGEAQELSIDFDLESLATFDKTLCANILPAGEYVVGIGNSSRNLTAICIAVLDKIVVVQRLSHVGGECDFEDFIPKKRKRDIPAVEKFKISSASVKTIKHEKTEPDIGAMQFVSGLSDQDVLKLLTGDFSDKAFFDRKQYTAGQVGQTAYDFESKGVKSVSMADGPAGLHISGECGIDENGIYSKVSDETKSVKELLPPEVLKYLLAIFPAAANENRGGEYFTQYCTAVPIETAIAQSFDTSVAKRCGEIFLDEMRRYNIDCHLAPALNIHRHPLCGRNFEYFSEDPYLSGVMAAEIVNAVQTDPHRSSCLKHFVCNEQDTNRLSSDSVVSERALRDIYMKPFEIAIARSHPKAVMSSYNLVNGIHTSERKDLMETALREELGFDGIVMSDWVGYPDAVKQGFKHRRARSAPTIAAGNDLMMPGQEGHYNELLQGLRDGVFTIEWARKCAARLVEFAWKLKGE